MKWIWVLYAAVGLLVAGLWGFLFIPTDLAGFQRPPVIEAKQERLVNSPALTYAKKMYESRGNKYIWGPNDCSVFVTDYLKGVGAKVQRRYTTTDLVDPGLLAKLGFTTATDSPQPGDIIVFKYKNDQGALRGHCGIVTEWNRRVYVVHNTEAYGGVIMQTLPSFQQSTQSLPLMVYRLYRPVTAAHGTQPPAPQNAVG